MLGATTNGSEMSNDRQASELEIRPLRTAAERYDVAILRAAGPRRPTRAPGAHPEEAHRREIDTSGAVCAK